MYCRKCGNQIEDNAQFCVFCGAKVEVPNNPYQQPGYHSGQQPQQAPRSPQMQQTSQQPQMQRKNMGAPGGRPKKKGKKAPFIILIVMICVLCLAIIGSVAAYFMIQRNKDKEVTAFQQHMDEFEGFLKDLKYESIEKEVASLLRECELAIKNKATEDFDALKDRITAIRQKLGDISTKIGTLSELKSTYEDLLNNNYLVPDDLNPQLEELFEQLQGAIDNGSVNKLEDFKTKLSDLTKQIEDADMSIIQMYLDRVSGMQFVDLTASEESALDDYFARVGNFMDEKNYIKAIEAAEDYSDYAKQLQEDILERQEESRRQSEETAGKNNHSGYVFPESDSSYLTEADVRSMSKYELLIGRNEIYARHGRLFKDESIQAYFDKKSWYYGYIDPDAFDVSVFNVYEKANIEFIKNHE